MIKILFIQEFWEKKFIFLIFISCIIGKDTGSRESVINSDNELGDEGSNKEWMEEAQGNIEQKNNDYSKCRPYAGMYCRENSYACSGVNNPKYLQCVFGRLVELPCGENTYCVRNEGFEIFCGERI
ncbi:hypothetical protein AYI68_g538 [Smittium mucronatum]|uniref:Carbohydrate-binding module family 19 domain-containing protein n=1 Tax=Smittium mucronatum TaxID=133383 RepID=A0A1R0H824_9FUNG|nr:hypothetical protein AYI68_g538 [Smittium mucronatum]